MSILMRRAEVKEDLALEFVLVLEEGPKPFEYLKTGRSGMVSSSVSLVYSQPRVD
jgi:hypothetical protein